MGLYNEETIIRALEHIGVKRAEYGLAAFGHEPVGSYCNCFATEAFRDEIQFYNPDGTAVADDVPIDSEYHTARFKAEAGPGPYLDSYNVARRLWGEDDIEEYQDMGDDLSHLFCTGYEDYPEKLIGTVLNWLTEQEVAD